jgi:hypothetical protein
MRTLRFLPLLVLMVLMMVMPVFAPSPPTFVVGTSVNTFSGGGTTTTSGAISVTSGDTLVVFAFVANGATMAMSDSQTNSYTAYAGTIVCSLDSGECSEAFSATASVTGTDTVTLTVGSAQNRLGFQVADYGATGGVGATAILGDDGSGSQTSYSNNLVTTTANSVVLCHIEQVGTVGGYAPGAGETNRMSSVNGDHAMYMDDRPAVTATTYTCSASWTNGMDFQTIQLALKSSGSPPPPPPAGPSGSVLAAAGVMGLITAGLGVAAGKFYQEGNEEDMKKMGALAVAAGICVIILVAAGI